MKCLLHTAKIELEQFSQHEAEMTNSIYTRILRRLEIEFYVKRKL